VRQLVSRATLLIGSDRHLSYFPNHPAQRLVLGDLTQAIKELRNQLSVGDGCIVVLVTGDPLFLVRPTAVDRTSSGHLTFHPHLSAVGLAFNRIKVPWQDARVISAHGRSFEELMQALQQGTQKIAVLTDQTNTPGAIPTCCFRSNQLLPVLGLRESGWRGGARSIVAY